jgi:hypothetical protein
MAEPASNEGFDPRHQVGAPSPLRWVATNIASALAVLTGLSYAAVRLAYVGYYGNLGVTPREVGFDAADGVGRAIAALVVVCAAVLTTSVWLLTLKVVYTWFKRSVVKSDAAPVEAGASVGGGLPAHWPLLLASSVPLVLAAMILMQRPASRFSNLPEGFGARLAAVALVTLLIAVVEAFQSKRVRTITCAALAMLGVGAVIASAYDYGIAQSSYVRLNGVSAPGSFGPDSLIGDNATCVFVHRSEPRPSTKDGMLYLGRNDGVSIFYDLIDRASLRIPSNVVSTVDSGNCKEIADARWEAGELPARDRGGDRVYRLLSSATPSRGPFSSYVAATVAAAMERPGFTRNHAVGDWARVGTLGIVVNSITPSSLHVKSVAPTVVAIQVNYEVDNLGIGDSALPSFLASCSNTERVGPEVEEQADVPRGIEAYRGAVKTIELRVPLPCANPRLLAFFHDPVTASSGETQGWHIPTMALAKP